MLPHSYAPVCIVLNLYISRMDCKTTINSIGIILNIIGVYVVFIKSPINFSGINDTLTDNVKEKDVSSDNNWMKRGVYIVIIGSILQLVSNYLPLK